MTDRVEREEERADLLKEMQELNGFGRWVVICELAWACSPRDLRKALEIAKKEVGK